VLAVTSKGMYLRLRKLIQIRISHDLEELNGDYSARKDKTEPDISNFLSILVPSY